MYIDKFKILIGKVFRFIMNSEYRFLVSARLGLLNNMPDKEFLQKKFKACMGYELNIDNPNTFNEKLQWLKLYDRRPEYTTMVDKYEVKKYVANVIGQEYIIPTLGVWNSFDEIDFDNLPNQFVLKCTHDSGGLVIVKDKNSFNKVDAKKKIEKSLKRNYYYSGREWPYKNVKPRIIAEEYMEDEGTSELRDYKFFTFSGKVKALFIASERQNENEETKFDFFDRDFNHLDVVNGHPNAVIVPKKPLKFNEMIYMAEQLSKGIPHLRVDFYEVNGRVYFGELTFSHWGGFVAFEPSKWDEVFGEWIVLPK